MSIARRLSAFNPRVISPVQTTLRFILLLTFCLVVGRSASAGTIAVPAGSDFQAALAAAQPGDTIILEAGATYTGPFTLPNKPGEGWITVRTSAPDSQLPAPGVRVTPAFANVMPKLVAPGRNLPALLTAAGAHHYRFVGIEFKPVDAGAFVTNLIELGDGSQAQDTLAEVPHHLVIDRCYIHGDAAGTLRRGIALNSAHTEIVNSYISEAKDSGRDTQAVCGWNGPGPFKIINNYLEGAGENLLFGGADPSVANLVPSDIEIRRNHFSKPVAWRDVWTVKNLFELKNARRVVVDGNLFENNWLHGQSGYAILFTVRNQDGTAPWSTVEDVQFINNIVRHTASAINVLGRDDLQSSQQTARLTIRNNLFEDVSGQRWGGQGNFLLITEGRDVVVEHNTILHTGNVTMAYGKPTAGFVFRNNLMPHNDYGVFGGGVGYGTPALAEYFPGAVFEKNVIAGAPDWRYPAGNFYPASLDAAGFANPAGGDYRLVPGSPYKNAGTDGRDLGCDFDALNAALNGATAGPTPTPTPTATPAPTPAPTPGQGGRSRAVVGETKREAQAVSNQLAVAQATQPGSSSAAAAESTTPQISTVVAGLERSYAEFVADRGLYPAAARIESALVSALTHARSAATSSQQGQFAEVKARLRRSIDFLEAAYALMVYGNVENPIDTPEFFVRQHYVDFLDREPDDAGLAYWAGHLGGCASWDSLCREAKRVHVSAAFFMSIEFQKTGYLVHRLFRAVHGRAPLYQEFGAETQEVAGGVIVGQAGWEAALDANTRAYFEQFVARADFKARFGGMTNEQFVGALLANAGVALPAAERNALLAELNSSGSRAVALRKVVESAALSAKEKNPAFVEMQYFGYMRRDFDQVGFEFWLTKLVNHNGDHVSAQMVKSFLDSGEYRERFPRQ